MVRSLLLLSFTMALAACSGAPIDEGANDGELEIVDESALSLEATPLVGHWRSKTAVDDLYATELRLDEDGTFTGQLRRGTIDGTGAACKEGGREPCIVAARGRWRLGKEDELQLRVVKNAYVSEGKTLTIAFGLSSVPRVLTLHGASGQQVLSERAGCEGVKCGSGSRCEENAGSTACVVIAPRAR